jgi:DNA-binding beta-propeller fold protein YncE
MHVIPQLRNLERQYPNELQVVSVHSPKFPTERESANLRQAVLRLRIEHPVINDADFALWREYGARAWPSLYFIDPRGNVLGRHEGELPADVALKIIEPWFEEYRQHDVLAGEPLALQRETGAGSALSFPGRVEYDAAGERLFVADSNHDRIVVARLDGTVDQIIGGRKSGWRDGTPEEALFSQPQGMSVAQGALYVADLENHAIRRIDLETWHTTTIAGTGAQTRTRPQPAPGLESALNSPWDVVAHNGDLYIAMAGSHQLWRLNLDDGRIAPWAGSMAEGIIDGPRDRAELAQPSGLAVGPHGITFADSESSAVRHVGFEPDAAVSTAVGSGLFDFGDADGRGDDVRLQHPLDVAWQGDRLYVADTFNHKIKRIDTATKSATTLCGGLGDADGPLSDARFNEPGGICAGPDNTLIVADTNNHRLRLIDLDSDEVRTIDLQLDAVPLG